MRVENSGARYFGFAEYAASQGVTTKKKKKDVQKLQAQREKFQKHHLCKGCGLPMVKAHGSNIMYCANPACEGIKTTKKDKDGNEVVYYLPSYEVLDEKWADYADYVFEEDE